MKQTRWPFFKPSARRVTPAREICLTLVGRGPSSGSSRAQPGAHRAVVDEILDRLEQEQWPTHDVFSVRMALEEALCNAIKHGNRLDHRKKVAIVCKMASSRLWIKVTDEGAGFRPEHVPDRADPANLERPAAGESCSCVAT